MVAQPDFRLNSKKFIIMKPATERIYELLWKIQQEYSGVIPKANIKEIETILLNTIKDIKQEELENLNSN